MLQHPDAANCVYQGGGGLTSRGAGSRRSGREPPEASGCSERRENKLLTRWDCCKRGCARGGAILISATRGRLLVCGRQTSSCLGVRRAFVRVRCPGVRYPSLSSPHQWFGRLREARRCWREGQARVALVPPGGAAALQPPPAREEVYMRSARLPCLLPTGYIQGAGSISRDVQEGPPPPSNAGEGGTAVVAGWRRGREVRRGTARRGGGRVVRPKPRISFRQLGKRSRERGPKPTAALWLVAPLPAHERQLREGGWPG